MIIAGTAGASREGMLWAALENGRAGNIGILEYAVPDGTLVALDVKTPEGQAALAAGYAVRPDGKWVLNEPAIRAAHPGIGTLTTMGTIRKRFRSLPIPQFLREYAGQWPYDLTSRAISPADWEAARHGNEDGDWPTPTRFAVAYDIAPDQSSAALVAAWRDDDGVAHLEVLAHGPGDAWLPTEVVKWTGRHRGLPVGYDNIHSANRAVADQLIRDARPVPSLVPLNTADVTAAAAKIGQELVQRRVRVRVDDAMDTAADVAVRRSIGDASWAWGRRKAGGDVSPLVAGTNALRVYDQDTRPTAPVDIIF
jgi:hypothetical protein